MALETGTLRLGALVDDTATGRDDIDQCLRDIFPNVTADLTNAAVEITLINSLDRPAYIQTASFVPESTVGAAANHLSLQMFYDDGAGGAAVALTDLWSGVIPGTTAYTRVPFLNPVVATLIPVGSRIYCNVAVIAGGAAYDDTSIEAKLRYE